MIFAKKLPSSPRCSRTPRFRDDELNNVAWAVCGLALRGWRSKGIVSLILLMNGIAWLVAAFVAVPLIMLGMQCVLALLPPRKPVRGQRRRVALLVPAHNEAAMIASTIIGIRSQLNDSDRIVVVADNCSDDTAQLARHAGAIVVVRNDVSRRGKGFALDAGVRFLEQDPPDVVIVLDADCQAEAGTIDALARAVDGTGRPVQSLYLMGFAPHSGPEAMVSVFAFLVKNWVRARAMQRLAAPVLLTGSGMAFPWEILRQASLANAEIVEDLALGLKLTQQGFGPQFCETARVWSQLPTSAGAAVSQRTRWEHGYMNTMLNYVPRLVLQAFTGRIDLFLVALDLAVPPLSLLVLLSALACAIEFFLALATGAWLPFWILLGAGCLAALGIIVSWWRFARQLIPFPMLASIPRYVVGKIGIYRRFVGNRQTQWVRTERDGELRE